MGSCPDYARNVTSEAAAAAAAAASGERSGEASQHVWSAGSMVLCVYTNKQITHTFFFSKHGPIEVSGGRGSICLEKLIWMESISFRPRGPSISEKKP